MGALICVGNRRKETPWRENEGIRRRTQDWMERLALGKKRRRRNLSFRAWKEAQERRYEYYLAKFEVFSVVWRVVYLQG